MSSIPAGRVAEATLEPEVRQPASRAAVGVGARKGTGYLIAAICLAVIAVMIAPLVLSFFASIKTPAAAMQSPPTYLPEALSTLN